ncbi:MAG: helix-turn-helix domain-containing protein, partial [Proteobacteria bacterium]
MVTYIRRMDAKLFLVYLQQEFSRRAGRNPGYSLRTYANQLGIHHGTLSQIMRGHRPLTYRRIESLIKVLDVSPQQLAKLQSPASDVELKFSPLDEDHFASVSDWYHDAILELTQVSGFKSNARWI